MSTILRQSSGPLAAGKPAGWRGGASPQRPTLSRCRSPSSHSVATAVASVSLEHQTAPPRSRHHDPRQRQHQHWQQQQKRRPVDSHHGLASYRFRTADMDCHWLEALVREAVVHLAQAPFLQVTQTSSGARQPSFSCVPLPGTNSLSSQIWQDLTRQLSTQRDAESFLYLAPLQPSPARPNTSRGSANGGASSSAYRPPRHEVLTGIEQTPLVRGRVGDCCDDDVTDVVAAHGDGAASAATAGVVSQILPYVAAARADAGSRGARGDHHAADSAPQALREGSTAVQAEWGLVLQSRRHEALNGCYILSTSTSGEPGCDCTHFSVVRAQEGQGVTEQILSAWRT